MLDNEAMLCLAGTGEVNMQANVQVSGRSFGQLGPPVSCLIGQGVDDLADEVQAMDVRWAAVLMPSIIYLHLQKYTR